MAATATAQANVEASAKKTEMSSPADLDEARWGPFLGLPCQLAVDLPLPDFKVADFLKLRPGSVISTRCRLRHDVPLRINGTLIGWGEFDGSGRHLAVRVTELA